MDNWIYISLFTSCFLSATLIPFASEVGLAVVLAQGYDPIISIVVATIGNSLGGLTNYLLGRLGNPNWLKKSKLNPAKLEKHTHFISTYGSYTALLSWVPIIGDPLLLILGYLRVSMIPVCLFMVIGKLLRYCVIAWFFH
jgi:membrane protein YqaA with SNARE-associated domain